jgi:hypothetical protein
MKFFLYILYRIKSIYRYKNSSDGWIHAFLLLGAIYNFHILTLIGFVETIFNIELISKIRIDNGVVDRFVLFPLLVSPVFIILYFYYKKNKVEIVFITKSFKNESAEDRKRKGIYVVIYLSITILLLFISMISPALF